MKKLIIDVLEDMSHGPSAITLASPIFRETIANAIVAAIKTNKKGWFLDLSSVDGWPKLDKPIYEKTDEQKARETWVCFICGENTFEVDYDYIGSGTNHLGCELESDNRLKQYEKEKEKAKHLIDKSVEDYERNKLSEEIVDATGIGYIYESNDGGKTVYKRKSGSDKKELIWSSDEKGKFNKTTAK